MAIGVGKKLTEAGIRAAMLYELDAGLGNQWYSPIVLKANTEHPDGETHAWVGGVPGMAEKKADPKFDQIAAPNFFIRNRDWQTGIRIPKKDWLFNKQALIQKRLNDALGVVLEHPGILLQEAIVAGEATACYDGQYYFDTDHSEGASGTQDNDLAVTKAGSAIAAVDVKTAILAALTAIWGFKDDKGNECNLGARSFMVGASPALHTMLLEALGLILHQPGATEKALIGTNAYFDLQPQLLPRATGNKIYLFRKREPNMGSAFVLQVLLNTEPEILGEGSEYWKLHEEVLAKFSGTYNVGYGRWQDAVLATIS